MEGAGRELRCLFCAACSLPPAAGPNAAQGEGKSGQCRAGKDGCLQQSPAKPAACGRQKPGEEGDRSQDFLLRLSPPEEQHHGKARSGRELGRHRIPLAALPDHGRTALAVFLWSLSASLGVSAPLWGSQLFFGGLSSRLSLVQPFPFPFPFPPRCPPAHLCWHRAELAELKAGCLGFPAPSYHSLAVGVLCSLQTIPGTGSFRYQLRGRETVLERVPGPKRPPAPSPGGSHCHVQARHVCQINAAEPGGDGAIPGALQGMHEGQDASTDRACCYRHRLQLRRLPWPTKICRIRPLSLLASPPFPVPFAAGFAVC